VSGSDPATTQQITCCAGIVAEGGAEHGQQQPAVGCNETPAAGLERKAEHKGTATDRAQPEAARRSLPEPQGTDDRRAQRDHARNHRGVRGLDLAQRDRDAQRKPHHRAEGAEGQQLQMRTRRARRADQVQVGQTQQPRQGGTRRRHEFRAELRTRDVADSQTRHRERHREDRHAQQPQQQASTHVVSRHRPARRSGSWRRRGVARGHGLIRRRRW
jgi:hypothetical protein